MQTNKKEKEKIIIHGVDVSGCEYYRHTLKREDSPKWCVKLQRMKNGCYYKGHCYNFPCCDYKKDKMEKEPVAVNDKKEDLKIKVKQLCISFKLSCEENKRLHEQLDLKEQELENYKKQFKADTKEMDRLEKEIVSHVSYAETLEDSLTKKNQEIDKLKEDYLELKEKNGSNIVKLNTANEQLEKLKKENELLETQLQSYFTGEELMTNELNKLKSEIEILNNCNKTLIYKKARENFVTLKKYKQVLIKIKNRIEKNCKVCKKSDFYYFKLCVTCKANEILQEIKKVLENEN